MEIRDKEVLYGQYCKACKYFNLKENKDPCKECLTQGWNESSHKPIKFESQVTT